MEHRSDADMGAEVLRIGRDREKGVGCCSKQDAIPTPLRRTLIGSIQEAIHLWLFQVGNRLLTCLFEWNGSNLPGPTDIFRTLQGYEPSEGMHGCQSLIAGSNTAASAFLQIGKKVSHDVGAQIGDGKPLDMLVQLGASKGNQQREGIPIAPLRVARKVAFTDDVFQEKAANPGAE